MTTTIAATTSPNDRRQAVTRAVDLLRGGEVVALPTETVYGLAADALVAEAAGKIFETKQRPHFDPLIVHLPDRSWVSKVARISEEAAPLVERLLGRFWPGPLTLVLPRRELVPPLVTAGLETIAVRMSAHPLFAEVVNSFGKPLAAPSANRFGRISPTCAAHVMEELSGRIPLIVDGGPTEHGVESTVVAVRGEGIEILRAGPISREELSEFCEVRYQTSGRTEAPGQLPSHYRPQTPLMIVQELAMVVVPEGKRYGALVWSNAPLITSFAEVRRLTTSGNLREAAANLFRQLRELDHAELDCIVVEALSEQGLGLAIMERLRRAAHKQ